LSGDWSHDETVIPGFRRGRDHAEHFGQRE